MPKAIIAHCKEKMEKSLHALEEKLNTLRTGRASVQQFEHLSVEYYGTVTPLNQIGNISIPEPRLVVIQPWDVGAISAIEKALTQSSTSANPQSDGKLIRVTIPPLTDETRNDNIKHAKQLGEEAKVAIRNIRRDSNEKLKKLQHDGEISEDDLKGYEHDTQELTNATIAKVQKDVEAKEKEITER